MEYLRGLAPEEFEKVLKACIDKVEGRTEDDWQDIVDRYNLGIHKDVLRKAFASPIGGYSVYRYMTKSGLDEIKINVGQEQLSKDEIRHKRNVLARIRRDLSKTIEISNDIKASLKEDIKEIELMQLKRIPDTNIYKLIVVLSDWHIGYILRNYKGNNYNYDIAKKRLTKLINEVKKTCKLYDIEEVIIIQAGDIIENTYMRETQQAFECEFSASEQVSKATKLLYEFATTISQFANVDLYSLGGNHSRISSKSANIEGDNYNIIINETLKMLVGASGNERINVKEVDYIEDSCKFEVNGLVVKAFHGDKHPKEPKKLYDTEISLEGEKIDILIRGHFHSFNVNTQNNNSYVITNGSLFGYNPYSNNTIRSNTHAGQSIIVISNKEVEMIKNVNLQFN